MAEVIQLEAPAATELGPWRLGEVLGTGGMGQVYRAEHVSLGRKAAVKALHPYLASDPELVRRFFAEARIVNEIDHEHIVEIHDFVFDPAGRSYFVMELLDGLSLVDDVARRGPLPLERTVALARQICAALQAAHDKGVVHRDLKPENVMLVERAGQRDFVKLLDFGVAKVPSASPDAPHTVAGMILGTPEYMSPEQAGARAVDARSDIYSLGVLLYWMIAGTVPFKASGFDKLILLRLTTAPPRLASVTPSGEQLPPSLARVVARCLERDPADRFQTMIEVERALETVGAELALPRRGRSGPRWLWAGAAAVGVVAVALWIGLRRPPAPLPAQPLGSLATAPDPLPPLPRAAPARRPVEVQRRPAKHEIHKGAPRTAKPDPTAIVDPYEQ